MKYATIAGLGLFVVVLSLAGCSRPSETTKETGKEGKRDAKDSDKKDDHSHGSGPHGGAAFDFGKNHGEFMVDHDKQEATVYVLGDDLKKAAPIQADKLLLAIKTPRFEVELKPVPQEGDLPGKSSRFVGKHEKLGVVQEFEGTVTGMVDGKPASGNFKEEPETQKKEKK